MSKFIKYTDYLSLKMFYSKIMLELEKESDADDDIASVQYFCWEGVTLPQIKNHNLMANSVLFFL